MTGDALFAAFQRAQNQGNFGYDAFAVEIERRLESQAALVEALEKIAGQDIEGDNLLERQWATEALARAALSLITQADES